MYRIKENGNGSFHVYDSSTGNLVMVITNNNKENGGRSKPITTKSLSKGTPLLTPVNGHHVDELEGNGLISPSVNLPTVTLYRPKPRRFSKRNLKNKTDDVEVEPIAGSVSNDKTLKQKRKMEETYDDEYECVDQNTFMNFFGLASSKKPIQSVINLQRFKQRSTVAIPTYSRNHVFDVDLCSNLGQTMVENSRTVYAGSETPSSTVARYEMYCQASSRRMGNWDVPFRQANSNYAVTYAPKIEWSRTHLYSFNRRQRLQRYKRLQTGLTKRSRLLLSLCKDVSIRLKRVTNDEITSNCLLSLKSIVENTKPVIHSAFGRRSSSSSVSEYPCIDGTIVIEIDELGSETVKVSRKPSKMINQQTGIPWLSPHSLSTSGSRSQSTPRSRMCTVMLDDVQKSPLQNHSMARSSSRVSAELTNGNNDSDSDIEVIGMYPTANASKYEPRPTHVRNLLNSLSDPQSSDANNAINPLDFVATSYNASSREKTVFVSKKEQGDTIECAQIKNPVDSKVLCPMTQAAVAKMLNKLATSKKLSLTRRAGRVKESPQTRPVSFKLENDDDVVEVGRNNTRCPSTEQIELDMISRLVFLGRSSSMGSSGDSAVTRNRASTRNGDVSCVFKCHVCNCEKLFKKNAVNSVYCHMVNHGGLSCTSLVSNLEEFEGYEVAILQAFPITE